MRWAVVYGDGHKHGGEGSGCTGAVDGVDMAELRDIWARSTPLATLGQRCAGCRAELVEGDVVVVIDQGARVYVHRQLIFHRQHFDALLADAPRTDAHLDAEAAALVNIEALLGA